MYPAHIRTIGGSCLEQTCNDHVRNVSRIAGESLRDVGLVSTASLCGLVHDCGKYNDEFEDYLRRAVSGENVQKGSVIHSFAGVYLMLEKYDKNNLMRGLSATLCAYAVGSHHGQFDCVDEDGTNGFLHRLNHQEYDDRAIAAFEAECASKEEINSGFEKSVDEISVLIEKCRVLCKQSKDLHFYIGLTARLLQSAVMDADRKDTASFMADASDDGFGLKENIWGECVTNLEKYLSCFNEIRPIDVARKAFSDICKEQAKNDTGIYRLNIPTGGGKTLSGLRFALYHAKQHHKKRIILVSPLLSILDQNVEVVRKAVGNDAYILEHHSNVIIEDNSIEDNSKENQKYLSMTDSWDSPIIVTTLVQLLNTMFSGKNASIRRFHALCNSVVVIDEVQTVPPKMLSLFNEALNYLSSVAGTTFVLCSATQPCLENTARPIAVPITDIISESELQKYAMIFRRNKIENRGALPLEGIPDFLEREAEDGGSVLLVCNKKAEASYIFEALRERKIKCYHLSASMCMEHRIRILEAIKRDLQEQKPLICVSTQVLEAGVDISFSKAIRLAAGMDSVVQTAGRCNRNGEQKDLLPSVSILRCEGENLSHLGDIDAAKNATIELLAEYRNDPVRFQNDLASQAAINYYYRRLYSAMNKEYTDFCADKHYPSLFELLSDNQRYAEGTWDYPMRQAFRTAGKLFSVFDCDQVGVLIPYGEGTDIIAELQRSEVRFHPEIIRKLLVRAKRYTVSLMENQLPELEKRGVIYPICNGMVYAVNALYYDEDMGIITKEKEGSNCNILIL